MKESASLQKLKNKLFFEFDKYCLRRQKSIATHSMYGQALGSMDKKDCVRIQFWVLEQENDDTGAGKIDNYAKIRGPNAA